MKKIFLFPIFFTCLSISAQTTEVKSVASIGGAIKVQPGQTFSSICVVGEPAVSSFNGNILNGTIGYLDTEDMLTVDTKENIAEYLTATIFPSPNNGSFSLSVDFKKQFSGKLVLIDGSGKLVDERTLNENTGTSKFNYNVKAAGIYYCVIEGAGFKYPLKVVVE